MRDKPQPQYLLCHTDECMKCLSQHLPDEMDEYKGNLSHSICQAGFMNA